MPYRTCSNAMLERWESSHTKERPRIDLSFRVSTCIQRTKNGDNTNDTNFTKASLSTTKQLSFRNGYCQEIDRADLHLTVTIPPFSSLCYGLGTYPENKSRGQYWLICVQRPSFACRKKEKKEIKWMTSNTEISVIITTTPSLCWLLRSPCHYTARKDKI